MAHTLFTTVRVPSARTPEFIAWQGKLNARIASFPNFISLEIISSGKELWTIVQRFSCPGWAASAEHEALLQELAAIVGREAIEESERPIKEDLKDVTQVFVTQVSKENEQAFRDWAARLHHIEAQFPGFKGMYVQAPTIEHGQNWLTFLHFDTPENLDRWMNSDERRTMLLESEQLIGSLESHRVISSYAGWFGSLGKEVDMPPVWKQSMLVLLVLFPVVMLELRFLSPLTASLNPALGMFIGNAISVSLIGWPLMPVAIWGFDWWLQPKNQQRNLIGILVIIFLYAIEIALLWRIV